MALTFPASPSIGQKYPASPIAGVPTYTWDGEKWVTSGPSTIGLFVSKTGDTMTGDLSIAKASPTLTLNKSAVAQNNAINGSVGGSIRWQFVLGDIGAETGSNAGSGFGIYRFSDGGVFLDEVLHGFRDTGLLQVKGDPTVPFGVATKQYVDANSGGAIAPGLIAPFGGSVVPAKWLGCLGQNVSRTTYAALFTNIGTLHGTGDNSTTFGIPDGRARSLIGYDSAQGTGRVTAAVSGINTGTIGAVGGSQSLHAHNHGVTDPTHGHYVQVISPSDGYTSNARSGGSDITSGFATNGAYTGISIQNNGSGATQNMSPGIVVPFIIYAGV